MTRHTARAWYSGATVQQVRCRTHLSGRFCRRGTCTRLSSTKSEQNWHRKSLTASSLVQLAFASQHTDPPDTALHPRPYPRHPYPCRRSKNEPAPPPSTCVTVRPPGVLYGVVYLRSYTTCSVCMCSLMCYRYQPPPPTMVPLSADARSSDDGLVLAGHGVGEYVTCRHKDAYCDCDVTNLGNAGAGGSEDSAPHYLTCKGGGGFGLDHVCDAVFLDLVSLGGAGELPQPQAHVCLRIHALKVAPSHRFLRLWSLPTVCAYMCVCVRVCECARACVRACV